MPYSYSGLVGNFETFQKTIGAMIKREWDKTNTNDITPKFYFDGFWNVDWG